MSVPPLIFLGVCERVSVLNEANFPFVVHNFIGLKSAIPSHIFPINLDGHSLVFAADRPFNSGHHSVALMQPDGETWCEWTFELKLEPPNTDTASIIQTNQPSPAWFPISIDIKPNGTIAMEGNYQVVLRSDDKDIVMGELTFVHIPAPPLTPDRVAAIRSNPLASRWVRCNLACRYCKDEVRTYAGLERSEESENDKWIWYQDLPVSRSCRCKKSTFDLRSIRTDLHGLLGSTSIRNGYYTFEELYSKQALEAVCMKFSQLLEHSSKEQEIQVFIEQNPILLYQFSAERIFRKPEVLNKYGTDFAVLSSFGKLTLIEIERANLPLLTKNNEPHNQLHHAVNQVHSWFNKIDRFRDAVLDGMNLKADEVASIRGVVIAGRDKNYSIESLQQLKSRDWGAKIDFYTYDDLLSNLITLLRKLYQTSP